MNPTAATAHWSGLAASLFSAMINGYLKLNPETREQLAAEGNTCIGVEITDVRQRFCIVLELGVFRIAADGSCTPDVSLRGRSTALASLMLRGRGEPDVMIEGDADRAARLRAILRAAEIDWEEQLSRVAGDAVAHKTGETARAFQRWLKQTHGSLEADIAEYLTEESGNLPTRGEIESFMNAVDTLRSDTDRLEARIARLETGSGQSGQKPQS